MRALALLPLVLAPACTLISVDSGTEPPRLESSGLIDGHLAFGVPENDDVLRLDLFDGTSPGAVAELEIWKLLRLEVGLAGATVGLGPLDIGIGVLAYDPEVTRGTAERHAEEAAARRARQEAEAAEADVSEPEWEPEHDR